MKKNRQDYTGKVKKNNKEVHLSNNKTWILKIVLVAFILSLVLSLMTDSVIPSVPIFLSVAILILFITLGIIFDMIGVSVTVAEEKVFHSMASKKVKSTKTALDLIENSSKVSSFCNDVIGDVCGIISGSAGVSIALSISKSLSINLVLTSLILTSLIASVTIGGKAIGKHLAINKSNAILYSFARFLDKFKLKK